MEKKKKKKKVTILNLIFLSKVKKTAMLRCGPKAVGSPATDNFIGSFFTVPYVPIPDHQMVLLKSKINGSSIRLSFLIILIVVFCKKQLRNNSFHKSILYTNALRGLNSLVNSPNQNFFTREDIQMLQQPGFFTNCIEELVTSGYLIKII